MTNKLKSLIYLTCFILSAVVYHVSLKTDATHQLGEQHKMVKADIAMQPYADTTDEDRTH